MANSLAIIGDEVRRDLAALRGDVATLRGEVRALKSRTLASHANDLAGTENSKANRNDSVLRPLRSIESGNEIRGFPATIGAVAALNEPRVNAILSALALPTDGGLDEWRRRIRMAVGITLVMP